MTTNYEVDAFISSLRDEVAEVQSLVKNFLKVLDDAHNPDLAAARKRLRDLMQRDAEIGKHQQVWPVLAPWLSDASAPPKPTKPKGTVIKDIGVTPP